MLTVPSFLSGTSNVCDRYETTAVLVIVVPPMIDGFTCTLNLTVVDSPGASVPPCTVGVPVAPAPSRKRAAAPVNSA